jgi:hypothetical protein
MVTVVEERTLESLQGGRQEGSCMGHRTQVGIERGLLDLKQTNTLSTPFIFFTHFSPLQPVNMMKGRDFIYDIHSTLLTKYVNRKSAQNY